MQVYLIIFSSLSLGRDQASSSLLSFLRQLQFSEPPPNLINKPYIYSARQQKKALTTPHPLSTSTSTPILGNAYCRHRALTLHREPFSTPMSAAPRTYEHPTAHLRK